MGVTVQHVFTSPVPDSTATSIVRPSDWNSVHNVVLNLSGSDVSQVFSNAHVTFGMETNGYITASAPGGGGGNTGYVQAGTTNASLGTVSFADGGGVSFGINGQTVTASHNGLTTAAQSNHSHNLATTTTNGSLVIVGTTNSAGATIGVPPYLTTAQPVGAYLTTAAQSDHSHGNPTLALTNLSGTTASNSAGLTISLSANVGGGAGDGYNIIGVNGAGTNSATTLQLSNANNVTFGLNAGTITASASYAAQTVQTQPSGNIVGAGFTSTTTAGTAVVATQNSNGLSMGVPTIITNAITTAALSNHSHNFATTTTNGSQVIVATTNSAGATIAVPPFITTYVGQTTQTQPAGNIAGVGTTFAGANLSASMTMNSNGLNLSMSAAAPGGGGAINVSAGTTSGNLQTIEFSNANGVSWGLNGSTVTASVNAGGGAAETLTNYVPNQLGANTTFSSLGQNTVYFQHFIPDEYVTMSKIEMYARGSFVSSSNSQVYAQTVHYGLYSQDTGASSTRMTQIGSSSLAYSVSYNSTTAAGFTISQGAGSFTTSGTNTTMLTSISGPFHLYLPFEGSLQPDVKYAFGIRVSSATTGNTGAHRFAPLALSMMASTNMAKMYTSTVVASANSLVGDRDMGFYATTSASLPASYATSNLSQVVSRQRFYLQFEQN